MSNEWQELADYVVSQIGSKETSKAHDKFAGSSFEALLRALDLKEQFIVFSIRRLQVVYASTGLPATTNPETTPANWTQKGFEIFAKILHPEEQAHFRHLLSEYLRLYFVAEPKNRANLKLTTTLRLCGSAPNGLEEEWVTLTFAAYPAQENGRQPNFWICQMKPVPVGPLRDFIRGCIVLQKADGGKPTLLFQTQGRKHFKLSPTEKRVLQMLACGLNTQEAAELLGVKENTVKTHRKSMLSKSGALNMPHLITYCLSYGLL